MHKIIFHNQTVKNKELKSIAKALQGELTERRSSVLLTTAQWVDRGQMDNWRQLLKSDVNRIPDGLDPARVKLVISDMDSTLINIECIDEIADFANLKPQVSEITEAAMRGELDFEQSLERRVALLKGLDVEVLQKVYDERLQLNPGAETMLEGLRERGIKFALVSGGFTFFTDRLKERLSLDFTRANVLGKEEGKLTGVTEGPVIAGAAKAAFLLECCAQMGIEPHQTIAIGDGANDLPMLDKAGAGVAYHAKPKVRAAADCAIQYGGLDVVLDLLEG